MNETCTKEIHQKAKGERERERERTEFILIAVRRLNLIDLSHLVEAASKQHTARKRRSVLQISAACEYMTGFCRIIMQLILKDKQRSGIVYVLWSVLLLTESTYAR